MEDQSKLIKESRVKADAFVEELKNALNKETHEHYNILAEKEHLEYYLLLNGNANIAIEFNQENHEEDDRIPFIHPNKEFVIKIQYKNNDLKHTFDKIRQKFKDLARELWGKHANLRIDF